jgi:proline dehydrogenase
MGVQPLRSSLLWASQNKRLERLVRQSSAMRPLVSRFMPGETIADVLPAVNALKREQTPTIITYLGENAVSDSAADQTVAEYERLLGALTSDGADTHVSIKLTQFGWDLDHARALDRVRAVSRMAEAANTVLAIDMESSAYVDSTIDAYESLAREFRRTTLCVQAYLHRTPADLERLLASKASIRLVKGAYREPSDLAIQDRHEVTARYRELARRLLSATQNGSSVAFGTHDLGLLRNVRADAKELGLPQSAYEIQMLFGIQDEARRSLVAERERVRVLISYGKAWYPWFMRRLAEKPSNLLLVARK